MLFQPIMQKQTPYLVSIRTTETYPIHLHHEIEILCCLKDTLIVRQDDFVGTAKAGEFFVVSSMVGHEILHTSPGGCLVLEFGPTALRDGFRSLAGLRFRREPYSLTSGEVYGALLAPLFDEIRQEHITQDEHSSLIILGNLLKISAILLRYVPKDTSPESKDSANTRTIQKALELVYYHYNEPLTVTQAASLCGYGKSNFSRLFKESVGVSFHSYLNEFRVKNVCELLTGTRIPLDEIASACGFSDAKSLCRIFRAHMGSTPGEYRKHGLASPSEL